MQNPIHLELDSRRGLPGIGRSAVAVDLPGVDKRRLRRCSFDEGEKR